MVDRAGIAGCRISPRAPHVRCSPWRGARSAAGPARPALAVTHRCLKPLTSRQIRNWRQTCACSMTCAVAARATGRDFSVYEYLGGYRIFHHACALKPYISKSSSHQGATSKVQCGVAACGGPRCAPSRLGSLYIQSYIVARHAKELLGGPTVHGAQGISYPCLQGLQRRSRCTMDPRLLGIVVLVDCTCRPRRAASCSAI